MKAENIGYWWNDRNIEVYRIGGKAYALSGWNGEKYTESWECQTQKGSTFYDAGSSCEVRPVYRFEMEGIDLDSLEEDSPEWERATETVDFELC